jgi:hypothetical protein
VPVERIELPTFGLQNRCSTAELNRRLMVFSMACRYQSADVLATLAINRARAISLWWPIVPTALHWSAFERKAART